MTKLLRNDRIECSEDLHKRLPLQARSSGRSGAPHDLVCGTGTSRTTANRSRLGTGDVDGSPKCGLALGIVAAEGRATRGDVATISRALYVVWCAQ